MSRGDGKLLDVGLYSRDVLCFAEEFWKLSGLARDQTKLKDLDALEIAGAGSAMSLSRNLMHVNANAEWNPKSKVPISEWLARSRTRPDWMLWETLWSLSRPPRPLAYWRR